jgi:hypothetical protein
VIVAEDAGAYRVVTQPDHAHLAAEVLSLWRADGLADSPRRADVIFAAREHDNGWREADAAPRCDDQGRPVDFMAMPEQQRIEIWQRGTARFLSRRPYAALLIVRHARELHRDRRREAAWLPVLRQLDACERRLRRELQVGGRALAADYRLVSIADTLSLAVCAGWRGELALPGLRGFADGASTVRLVPLPLAGSTTFRVACRRIPLRCYGGDADLGGELAAARWQEMTVRLTG